MALFGAIFRSSNPFYDTVLFKSATSATIGSFRQLTNIHCLGGTPFSADIPRSTRLLMACCLSLYIVDWRLSPRKKRDQQCEYTTEP
jgi:hypothetical protein